MEDSTVGEPCFGELEVFGSRGVLGDSQSLVIIGTGGLSMFLILIFGDSIGPSFLKKKNSYKVYNLTQTKDIIQQMNFFFFILVSMKFLFLHIISNTAC